MNQNNNQITGIYTQISDGESQVEVTSSVRDGTSEIENLIRDTLSNPNLVLQGERVSFSLMNYSPETANRAAMLKLVPTNGHNPFLSFDRLAAYASRPRKYKDESPLKLGYRGADKTCLISNRTGVVVELIHQQNS